jgi:glycosyltransferase involved in cell wall biosynthesis
MRQAPARPRILVVSSARFDYGGAETILCQFIELSGERYHFSLLGQASPHYQNRLTELGALYIPWEDSTPAAFSPSAIRRLVRLLRHDLAADLVYTLDARASTLAGPAAKLAGLPYLHHKHSSPLHYQGVVGLKRLAYYLGEALLAWGSMDAQVFPSHKLYQQYLHQRLSPPHKSHYIPNGSYIANRLDYFAQGLVWRLALGLDEPCFVWLWAGRMSLEKSLDVLMAALAQIPPSQNWRLCLVGDGPQEAEIRAQCQALGLGERVHFWGLLPPPEVYTLMAAADAFVLPSRFENMPLVLLEALQMNLPCVVTPVGDSWALVGEGPQAPAGLAVPPEDAAALAQAMTLMMQDRARHQAFKAACQARFTPYTLPNHAAQLGQIIDQLLRSR